MIVRVITTRSASRVGHIYTHRTHTSLLLRFINILKQKISITTKLLEIRRINIAATSVAPFIFYKTTTSNYTNATLKHDLGGSLYNYLSKRKLLVLLIIVFNQRFVCHHKISQHLCKCKNLHDCSARPLFPRTTLYMSDSPGAQSKWSIRLI